MPADSLATWLIPAPAKVPQMLVDMLKDQDPSDIWLRDGAEWYGGWTHSTSCGVI